MNTTIASRFVNSFFCAPVLFDPDPADPACVSALGDAPAVSVMNGTQRGDSTPSGDFCCTDCLRHALTRLRAGPLKRDEIRPASSPRKAFARKSKNVQSVQKAKRAQRLQIRTGHKPAALKPVRLHRLKSVKDEAEAPYPLERADFRAALAQTMQQIQSVQPDCTDPQDGRDGGT
jgi:hypothetical protein